MKRHFIAILMLLIACSILFACAEEQAAQKASVDIKAAAATHTANIKATDAGKKPASPASAREAAAPAKSAAKTPADAAKTPAGAPAQPASKVPAPPTPDASKAPNAPPAAQGAAKAPGAPQAAAKIEDPPPALSVPPGYRYEPRGRRDPFVNPIPKPQAGVAGGELVPVVRPDGLPGVLVSEVKLSGIVHSADKEMNKAMLVVGRNTYFAKRGDSLFDGVVKEIRRNEVVFGMVSAATRKPINRDTVVRTGASSGTSAGEKK